MTPERWRKINDLFHEVPLGLNPRQDMLRDGTAGAMRTCRGVRSLLAAHMPHDEFLEQPAWGVAAKLVFDEAVTREGRWPASIGHPGDRPRRDGRGV